MTQNSENKTPLFYAEACCDTMMRKFAAQDLPPKGQFHYHQGVFLTGVYHTYLLDQKDNYFTYIKDWVDSIIDEKGEIHTFNKGQMDDMEPGVLLYPLYEKTKDERYKTALDTLLAAMEQYPRNEDGGYWHKEWCPNEMWLDGLYMGGPLCAEYGARFAKPEWFDMVAKQILLMEKNTKDEKTGLWRHACDCSKKAPWADAETGKSPEFWGRSIGWVPMAILEDLKYIPETHKDYDTIVTLLQDLLKAICKFQSEEGRWYQVVDKGDRKENWLENSCSCLFVAAICEAVKRGFLPESYLAQAKKGYEAVIKSLIWQGEDLLIGNICVGTGVGDYAFYCNRPTCENDLHGTGAFLLMCASVEKIM